MMRLIVVILFSLFSIQESGAATYYVAPANSPRLVMMPLPETKTTPGHPGKRPFLPANPEIP